ncbi:TIR domain-containing protein [Rhizobium daejeonense]
MGEDEQLVFISYTSGDRDRVEPIADALIASGVDAWMDKKRLKAGQNWDFEIRRALDKAALLVVFISDKSVSKRGYVQREIRLALEKAEEKLVDDIYLIPVLLDEDVTVPDLIKDLQFIRYNDEAFQEHLLDAVRHQLERLGLAIEVAQNEAEISWQFYSHREFRDGIPGYEADFRLPRLSSTKHPTVSQIGDIVRGELFLKLANLRHESLLPDPEAFNFGQDRYRRTHTLDASPQTPKIKGRILSLAYWLHSYYARAAHPNHGIKTYCFLVDPLCCIRSLEMIFTDATAALDTIRSEVRSHLVAIQGEDGDEYVDRDWIERGTETWNDFQAFTFEEKGIEIHFPPYQVAPYAAGPQSALVEYQKIATLVSPIFKSALDIEYVGTVGTFSTPVELGETGA